MKRLTIQKMLRAYILKRKEVFLSSSFTTVKLLTKESRRFKH